MNSEDIMTAKMLANYFKIGEETVYRLLKNKKIPAFKVGGSWRFKKSEIESWISEQK